MKDVCLYYDKAHNGHFQLGHPERPERLETIRQELVDLGLWEEFERVDPVPEVDETLRRVHKASLIEEVRRASSHGNNLDPDTYTTEISFELAKRTAAGTCGVTRRVWDRDARTGIALTRPPGHHATSKRAMGFCLFNNIAVAAEDLVLNRGARKIAIVDVDVHHGNGTQDIFYKRPDVFYLSAHQYPFYPGTGWYDETGAAEGAETTLNIPLPAYSGDEALLTSTNQVFLPVLERYQPEIILVSLGFDAHWKDPIANLLVSAGAYGECIQQMYRFAQAHCQGRFVLVSEGGYDLSAIRACTNTVVGAISDHQAEDRLGKSPVREDFQWETHLRKIKKLWQVE